MLWHKKQEAREVEESHEMEIEENTITDHTG